MSTAAAQPLALSRASRLAAMASIIIAMLIASMDATITNTTMPRIAEELRGGMSFYAWTFTAYMICCTVMTPIAGRISDLFGRRVVFSAGLILFLIGSLLCGVSDSMLQLVLFRAVQGLGAGLITPFPIIIAGDLFSIEQRGKIQALFTAMWGLSAVLAPLLGSFFMATVGWRWIFWVNIPLCVISFVLLLAYKEPYQPKRATVDVWGALLFTVGVSLLLSVTIADRLQYVYAAAGLAVLALFLLYERRHPSPILPLSLFRIRQLRWMTLNAFVGWSALFGTSAYVPLFLQEEGHSIFISGLALIGMSIGWMITAVPAGRWILKYGYTRLIVIGNVLLVGSGIMLLFFREGTTFVYVTVTMIVQGLAFGLLSAVSTIGSQQFVGPHEKGISTSLLLFSRNIGNVISITIMGGLLSAAGANAIAGIQHLFRFGAAASILALASAFLLLGKRTR
ncbi:MFS transporter [Cohnella nanjingensis]|uniref:MFS-type drug efflux transporter P55 n=1 Tax=Cohnella nanjingensis TaxID=1387779 RepID=A0A7X0RNA6_9BACL|nr:MFS transporter [Cohnella nanjingensis]MBB6669214.1 MFS transporter [Cohnella nanjingensis]